MDYDQALTYLQSLNKFGIQLGLSRIEELLARIGNPERTLKIIHIGGTNGKGSTSAILSAILQAGHYRVGLFTSPHLNSYTERYQINYQEIDQALLAKLVTEISAVVLEMVAAGCEHPTEFEVSTALAFLYFAREKVDYLILEVGLGGAIDSTNVVTPLIAVITNVSMDHLEYLGNTLPEIARVKAGIIKPGVPVVTATDQPEALAVITEVAGQKHAPLILVGKQIHCTVTAISPAGEQFNWYGQHKRLDQLCLPLLGRHQVINAATALAVVEVLQETGKLTLTEEQLRCGLTQSRWSARLELVQSEPLVVLDGAHNLAGAIALRTAVEEIFHKQKIILVIGMLADKERVKVVDELAPLAKASIVTKPNSPRSGDWEKLAEELAKYLPNVQIKESIPVAVETGLTLANPEDLVCITGSLYMVGEARRIWYENGSKLNK